MHSGEISFCDKVAYNIKSDDVKKYILDRIEKRYSLKIVHKHYEKFDPKSSVATLKKNPHMVCVRSNGNPYFLYLMKYNGVNYCIFIDKKIQQGYYLPRMIIVHLAFSDELFEDTILEGEMVKAKTSQWYFLCNDLLVMAGSHLRDMNHPRRISLLYGMFDAHHKRDDLDLFKFAVKTFFKYHELASLEAHVEQLPYTARGVYFKPLFMRFKDILYNFDDNLIKKVERIKYKTVKPFMLKEDVLDSQSESSTENNNSTLNMTKNFYVRKTATPDTYELFCDNGEKAGVACVPSFKVSKYLREITKPLNMVDKIQLSFEYSEKFNKWIPIIA